MTVPAFDPDFAGPAQWAAMYRACGLQVIPCWRPGEPSGGGSWKRPKLAGWVPLQNALVPDPSFAKWYGLGGEHADRANMGIITGACSGGVWVLDLDTQKTPQAAAWWHGLLELENSGLEPETVQQVTGGGGRQLLFRAPPGIAIPTNKTVIGVDIRGQAGFAVMPPSRHESGRDYAWVEGYAPWEIEIALAPGWLVDAVFDLVEEHGGATAPAGERTADPGQASDEFGQTVDGRETLMRNVVWHAVLELYRASSTLPPEPVWLIACEDAYLLYESRVAARGQIADKRTALEADGRGPTEFRRKFRREIRRWGTAKMVAAAARPHPSGEGANPPPPGGGSHPSGGATPERVPLRSAFPIDEAKIPVRDWIVPGLALKRNLSVLVAPPGSGKSLLTLQIAIMIATGMEWAGWRPRRPEKVLVINSEDDVDEMQRRLVAACREMGVDPARLVGWLFLAENPESIVIAQADAKTKTIVRMPLVDRLIETIRAEGIGFVVADPFAETFMGDENSNSEVKWAGILWREVARATGTGLLLVHHTKKYAGGMAGDADASRGGGALIGTARILSTLFTMTEDEALAMDVAADTRTSYVRYDDAKANHSKVEAVRWFEKRTITLNNGTGIFPGDDVGVLVPWRPPGALDGVTMHDIGLTLDAIDRGLLDEDGKPSGRFYTLSSTSSNKDRWAGKVLERMLGCSEKAAKDLLKKWHGENVLETFDYTCPMTRRMKTGVRSIPSNRPGTVTND